VQKPRKQDSQVDLTLHGTGRRGEAGIHMGECRHESRAKGGRRFQVIYTRSFVQEKTETERSMNTKGVRAQPVDQRIRADESERRINAELSKEDPTYQGKRRGRYETKRP